MFDSRIPEILGVAAQGRERAMAVRHIYLKIEQVFSYSTVEPEFKVMPPKQYRRDCMRNPGHESAVIPSAEVEARRLTALVYREYLDPGYLVPRPDKLVSADVNEPVFSRRVPGAVIYAQPRERLKIHVLNGDSTPHSFHVHGLRYGIDSDGAWPLGTQSSDGRRSDEICPNQSWTYTFDITEEMVGAWPFHDHARGLRASINRGLFGGIVVRTRELHEERLEELELPAQVRELLERRPRLTDTETQAFRESITEWAMQEHVHPFPHHPRVIEVPLFFHFMEGSTGTPAFDSGNIPPGGAFEVTFGAAATFSYHCSIHPFMHGTVNVVPGGQALASVQIKPADPALGLDMRFDPASVPVGPGGKVHWTNVNPLTTHTVTADAGAGISSYCFNGRSFVGNTPTILAHTEQRIRWYVFNLDLGEVWHNYHPHGQRWQFAGHTIDVRSISPAESFIVDTEAPPVLLLPDDIEDHQAPDKRLPGATSYELKGDFLVHCHIEMHMGQGLAAVVRSRQTVWLTPAQADQLAKETGLPMDPGDNSCPVVDLNRCAPPGCGTWLEVAGPPGVTMMHAALLPDTNKVLFWGYHHLVQSRLWDYSTPAGAYSNPANQPADVAPNPPDELFNNLHSAGHAFIDNAEGTVLAHGGESQGQQQSLLFHPATLRWEQITATARPRFYPSTLTLHDGKLLTIFGGTLFGFPEKSIEVYDPQTGTWPAPKALPPTFDYVYYPWTYLLPGGDLFIAGHQGVTRRFDWTANPIVDDPAQTWNTIAGDRSFMGDTGELGTSVLLPLRPPLYAPRVVIAGGDNGSLSPADRVSKVQLTAEMIDLSVPAPAWTAVPDMNVPRPRQFTATLLPDGKVFIVGGVPNSPGPAEIFDPDHPADGWLLCAPMNHVRGYHSSNILLADGSVLVGGDSSGGEDGANTPNERYFPGYFSQPRPVITGAPATVAHGAPFTVQTPNATSIAEVVLIRPGAVTHGWNQSQRFVGCAITGTAAGSVDVLAPPDGNVAPPGRYLLFVVDGARVPSVGRWIRVTP
jgi:plastocyanin